MHTITEWLDIILHLNLYLGAWINAYGTMSYAILFVIIFCETGLVITPFLPGDSLLFATGSLLANTHLNIHLLIITLIIAAICGDNVNYWLGRNLGPKVFTEQARWFKKAYLQKTHQFYAQYGAKTIIIARFIPIIRTFAPFVAGIGSMTYGKFLCISLISATLWVASLLYISYCFGKIAFIQSNFSIIILGIILFSLLPILKAGYIGFMKRFSL